MLNNPKESKVIISKGSIGQTFEDIETDSKTIYSVADNIAFMEVLFNKNEHLDHIFHVSEQSKNQLFFKNSSISENHKNSKKKNKELLKQKELDYTNKYELETDFSKELKDLKPKSELNSQTHFTNTQIHEIQKKFDKTKQEFLKKFDFTHSDIDQNQLQDLMNMLLQNKNVYSQHKYDVGLIKQKFHVKLLPNSVLTKQRPSRVSFHYQEKLNDLLDQLCKSGIIREMGSNTEIGSEFINPNIILPKGNIVKLVIDARYLNSITDLSRYSWPLEPIGSLITKLKGNFFTTSDLCSAYNQVPLTEETEQLTSFVIGSKQYTFKRGFYGLCGLPNFFSRIMTIHFAPLIKRNQAVTYIDDTIMQAQTVEEMFDIIATFHDLLRKSGLKAQPEKTKFFFKKSTVFRKCNKYKWHTTSQEKGR